MATFLPIGLSSSSQVGLDSFPHSGGPIQTSLAAQREPPPPGPVPPLLTAPRARFTIL